MERDERCAHLGQFKGVSITRYGYQQFENPFEDLADLKQTGTVEEFIEAFELISYQVG